MRRRRAIRATARGEGLVTCSCGYAHSPESATHCKLCGLPLVGAAPPPSRGRAAEGAAEGREHQLVAEGSPPLRLASGQVLMIGRAEGSGLPIPSQRVSRQHAEVVWRAGLPVLRNLSETGSTLVNGKAVKEHELRDGDRIQIGPYECVYKARVVGAPEKFEAQAPAGGATIIDEGGDALAGSLAEMSVFSLLRSFEVRGRSGTLVLRAGSREGTMVLDKGKLTKVDLEGQRGKQALFLLLSWREGTYSFSLDKRNPTGKIFRTFNYAAVGPDTTNDLKGTISDLLEEAQDAGVEEPLPPGAPKPPPRPAPAPPRPGAPRPGRPGAGPTGRRPPPPPPRGGPPPRGR
ncbi:MAG: FHA domain-containing protein [Planctomycetes bacterium]|nr:FHA domain-containing protein [Planctomycetota bacterium]